MDNFGGRLREERKRLGMTQTEFADVGGVQKTTQSNYENNIRLPDAQYLGSITKIGIDIAYIITGARTIKADITTEEQKLVENYRAMDDSAKLNIQAVGDAFAQSKPNLKTG
ncbi:helix-turn-helix transcriptional regulator [Candidatus Fukatsuia symbiotica]|uniref:HTH cro/C1-type domain-containing protein n=1 Tax=Candidatus Fukatsuia symbiotica TaxID=1878942 RepID=A0A2U8I6C1_9GAMM|nr:helix-turn-helix transcriptional regulator [Candidatus Fukatsuia symbiotica]AWK14733.1 hypothetical protein CCS41_10000 [Candidatus Fukatsuia symbiotica]MEA9445063.1 helix-turn-helix transcriptional regulator [Candidatus Fukatsuia symbiotica]